MMWEIACGATSSFCVRRHDTRLRSRMSMSKDAASSLPFGGGSW